MSADRIIDVFCRWGNVYNQSGWTNEQEIGALLRRRNVEMAFVASALARRFDPIAGNEEVAEVVGRKMDQLRGWLVVHPDRADDASMQMRKLISGNRFIGAAFFVDPLNPDRPVTYRNSAEVLTAYRRYSKPLLVEVRTAEGMAEASRIAHELGTIKVIASGMGGEEWREAIDLAVKPMNLYLDISGITSPERLEYALSVLQGTRRLLFASGAPRTDPAALVGMVDDVPLRPEDRHRLLYLNAARIFGVGEDEEAPAGDLTPLAG